jgi:hypothetical protein
MGKQNEPLRIGKTLHVHGSALPMATALNGKISESVVSNFDRCTCQILEIGTETKV